MYTSYSYTRYNGIQNNLEKIFAYLKSDTIISLCFNIDGLPLFKSSKQAFWPILGKIFGNKIDGLPTKIQIVKTMETILEFPDYSPFVVAIWSGDGKPLINEFLQQFVEELQSLLRTGLTINGHWLIINIKCFICDTPARAYIKGAYFV